MLSLFSMDYFFGRPIENQRPMFLSLLVSWFVSCLVGWLVTRSCKNVQQDCSYKKSRFFFGRPIENRRPMFLSLLVSWLVG